MKKTNILCFITVFILLSLVSVIKGGSHRVFEVDGSPSAQTKNLIANPSFEQAKGKNPAAWQIQRWGGAGQFSYASIARTGNRSLMISSEKGGDLSWKQDVPVRPFASISRL